MLLPSQWHTSGFFSLLNKGLSLSPIPLNKGVSLKPIPRLSPIVVDSLLEPASWLWNEQYLPYKWSTRGSVQTDNRSTWGSADHVRSRLTQGSINQPSELDSTENGALSLSLSQYLHISMCICMHTWFEGTFSAAFPSIKISSYSSALRDIYWGVVSMLYSNTQRYTAHTQNNATFLSGNVQFPEFFKPWENFSTSSLVPKDKTKTGATLPFLPNVTLFYCSYNIKCNIYSSANTCTLLCMFIVFTDQPYTC